MSSALTVPTIANLREVVQSRKPIVQCIVPPIAGLRTLDFLMASGAVPVETEYPDEARTVAEYCHSLVVSLQNLGPDREAAAKTAISMMNNRFMPWVLQPSQADIMPNRLYTVQSLTQIAKPAVIFGDYTEIIALADGNLTEGNYREAARTVALQYDCIVAAAGDIDFITDGTVEIGMAYNEKLFTRAAGAAPVIAGLIGAFCAVDGDYYRATAAAIALVRVAAELADAQTTGIGSFMVKIQDEIEIVETTALIDCIEIVEQVS